MPVHLIEFLKSTFSNLEMIDITSVKDNILSPDGLTLNGKDGLKKAYPIKVFAILLSSFLEVLWLDADNIPLIDPVFVFKLKGYRSTGAVLWPDICNVRHAKYKMWELFDLPPPSMEVYQRAENSSSVVPNCYSDSLLEVEPGQFVLHKRRVWRALMLMAFVNKHYDL